MTTAVATDELNLDSISFTDYRELLLPVGRAVFEDFPQGELDEQAGPAYFEGLGLSRWIFWKRVADVIKLLPSDGGRCLDFGCGFGLLTPLLSDRFSQVTNIDFKPELANRFLQRWSATHGQSFANVDFATDLNEANLEDHSIDLMLALDVLEHVDDLDELLAHMHRLLKPNGKFIVTGPTENSVYKLGRRIVGFSGDYHERSIYDIEDAMKQYFDFRIVGRIGFPLTLFHVLVAQPLK